MVKVPHSSVFVVPEQLSRCRSSVASADVAWQVREQRCRCRSSEAGAGAAFQVQTWRGR